MSAVEPDDVSPWTRDDWTGTDTPRLDALTVPDAAPGSAPDLVPPVGAPARQHPG